MSTGIGSAIAFFTKRTNTKFLSIALGFSAGVMIYVSFVEILPQAFALAQQAQKSNSDAFVVLAFFIGIAVIFLIDMLIPKAGNPHELHKVEDMQNGKVIPEGVNPHLKRTGILMAVAIAIHNIPEGVAVSVPIYYATGKRSKAFWLSFLSGMAEPLGGLLGYFFMLRYMTNYGLGMLMAAVAGIMVFISVDELLPGAEKYGHHHYSVYGFVAGMAVMAISLLVL